MTDNYNHTHSSRCSSLPVDECHLGVPSGWIDDPDDAPIGAKIPRAKPDKGRRRKHEDLYLLHFRSIEGDKTPFTGDLHHDLEIFRVQLIDVAGYRPGQDILVPAPILSAVAERYVRGGGFYSFNAVLRNLDSATFTPEFHMDHMLKLIRDYTPDFRLRKLRKYLFQLYIKNFPTAFSCISKFTNTWRSDMFNSLSDKINQAAKEVDLTTPLQKAMDNLNPAPFMSKISAGTQKLVEDIDVSKLATKFTDSITAKIPDMGNKLGHSAGQGIVSGVVGKFNELFSTSLTSIQTAWANQPAIVKRFIIIAGVLSVISLTAFFGYKLVMYCFPIMFGPTSTITTTSDGGEEILESFSNWFANVFTDIKSFTPFSGSSMFARMKDAITIFTFFEKLSNAVKALQVMITSVADWACTKVTGSPFFDSTAKLRNLFTRIDNLLTSLDHDSYVTLEEQEQFCDNYSECSALADGIFKLDPTLHLKMVSVLTNKQSLYDKYLKNTKAGETRQEPVLLWFHGAPGVSKSNSLDGVFQGVFNWLKRKHPDAFADLKEPIWRSGLIGTRSLEDKFWSNYQENPFFLMDDVFQITDPQSMAAEPSILIMAKQRARFPLTSAAVSDKGKLFFKSKIIACTSNYPESLFATAVPSMQCGGAFQRRRDFIIELTKIPNVPAGPMGTLHQWDNINFNVKYWDFATASHLPLFSKPGLQGLSHLIAAVTDRYIAYYETHKQMTSFSMANHMDEIMSNLDPETTPAPLKINKKPLIPPDEAPLIDSCDDSDQDDDIIPVSVPPISSTLPPTIERRPDLEDDPPLVLDDKSVRTDELPPPQPPSMLDFFHQAVRSIREKLDAVKDDPALTYTVDDVKDHFPKGKVDLDATFEDAEDGADPPPDDPPPSPSLSTSTPPPNDPSLEAALKKLAETKATTDTSDMFSVMYTHAKGLAARVGIPGVWKLPLVHFTRPHPPPRFYQWAAYVAQYNALLPAGAPRVTHAPGQQAPVIPGVNLITIQELGHNLGLEVTETVHFHHFLRKNHFIHSLIPNHPSIILALSVDILSRNCPNDDYLNDYDAYHVMRSTPFHHFAITTGIIPDDLPVMLDHFYVECAGCLHMGIVESLCDYVRRTVGGAIPPVPSFPEYPRDAHSNWWWIADVVLCFVFYMTVWIVILELVFGAIRLCVYSLRALGVLSPEQAEFFSDSGDVELTNRQTAVAAHIRKNTRPPTTAVSNSNTTTTTSDHSTDINKAAHRLMSNLYLVDFNKPTPDGMATTSNFCYFLGPNMMLLPRHYLAKAPFASITIYPTYKPGNTELETISWKDIVHLDSTAHPIAKKLARRDLTVLYVPGLRFMKKDLFRMLPRELDLGQFQNYHGVERLGFDCTQGPLTISRTSTAASPKLFGLTQDKIVTTTTIGVNIYDYFRVRGITGGPGVCMSPYVPLNPSNDFKIMGFHVASDNPSVSSVFSPFTREDYIECNEAFKPSVSDIISYVPIEDEVGYQSDTAPVRFTETLDTYLDMKVHYTIDRKASMSPKTSLIETIVSKGIPSHPPPFPPDDAPAALTARAKELSLRKLQGKVLYYDSTVFSDDRVFEGSFPPHLTKDFCIRFMSLEQTINGIKATRLHSTDLTKASGFPYNLFSISKKSLIKRDHSVSNICVPSWYNDPSLPSSVPPTSFFSDRNEKGLWVHPEVQRHFYWFHHWSRLGMTPLAIYTFFLKDELRPIDRVKKEYSRYINAGQIAHFCFCRSVMGFYTDQLESNLDDSIQLGINPFSPQWARLFRRLASKCPAEPRFVLHDVSGWDIRFQVNYFAKYIYRFRSFFSLDMTSPHDRAWYNSLKTVYISTLMPLVLIGDKIIAMRVMPSGGERTSQFNSTANDAEHRQIWYWHQDHVHFNVKNELAIFGDDSILSGPFDSEYNGVTIGEVRKAIFNHDCTESTKDETLVPYQPTSNAMFLSRGFREEKGLILAPLKINSIQAMCRYIMKPTDKSVPAQTALNIHIALNEFALHGKEVFDKALSELQPFLLYLGPEYRYPHTYESIWPIIADMYSGELPATEFKIQFFRS